MAWQIPAVVVSAALTAYRTASLNGGAVGLFKNDVTPDENTVIGDLTEPGAEWTGYARITVAAWGAIFTGPAGPECVTQVQFAGPSGGSAGDPIYGVFLVDSGGVLVAAARFDEGVQNVNSAADILIVDLHSRGILGGVEVVVSTV